VQIGQRVLTVLLTPSSCVSETADLLKSLLKLPGPAWLAVVRAGRVLDGSEALGVPEELLQREGSLLVLVFAPSQLHNPCW
jgi:hypothetical protein